MSSFAQGSCAQFACDSAALDSQSDEMLAPLAATAYGELVAVIQRLSLARTAEQVQEVVRTAARRLTGSDGATFVLRDGDKCHYVDEDAISPLWKGQRFPLEACISGWAMLNRRSASIPDIYLDSRIPHDAYRLTFVKSLVMVPIRSRDPIGAIGNYWAVHHEASEHEMAVLQALADSTAVAMENARLLRELEEARLETLRRLALAAEYRDDDTYQHTERVGASSAAIARLLGWSSATVALIRQAAPLHDIGKLSIADRVLRKAGALTDHEFELVKAHTTIGAEILSGSNYDVLGLAEEIALSHHEWWDGSRGYPLGLRGEQIPLSGQIVAVADVFDALTHSRPYKHAWSARDALAEIRALSGRQFNPDVIDALHDAQHELLAA